MPLPFSDPELELKTRNLIYFRLAFAGLCMLVATLLRFGLSFSFAYDDLFKTAALEAVGALLALAIAGRVFPDSRSFLKILNAGLIGLDVLCVGAAVLVTKGTESDLYFLYLLPILLASYCFGPKGVFATAFLASGTYLAVLLSSNWNILGELVGDTTAGGLAHVYVLRLWQQIWTRAFVLGGVAFVWAVFCNHMSLVANESKRSLSSQLAANETLLEELQSQAQREKLSNTISLALRRTLELPEILKTTVQELSRALNGSRCLLLARVEGPESQLCFDSAVLHHEGEVLAEAIQDFLLHNSWKRKDESASGKIIISQKPFVEADFAQIRAELESLKISSILVRPLMYGQDLKGVLAIVTSAEERTWLQQELELINSVAGQVAIAIEHAQLLQELSIKNQDLTEKNSNLDAKNLELREMQSQMIHHEKMASLGRIVAGIAHELNNPVNFVHGNLPYLKEYFEELKKLIALLDRLPEPQKTEAEQLKKSIRYDFLVTDLDHIIADLADGAERIRQIIRNLRSFSRLDEAELKEASIEEGIESTLKILSQYYGTDKVPVKRLFAKLPAVLCYPGKLNQVWMNLLSNAAQAVANRSDPLVTVSTELKDGLVIVAISDNGSGIKVEDRSKIFEPFYTTKPVGQGTGLGLSICHTIVESHRGRIWFESEPGRGTTFFVSIPMNTEDQAAT